MRIEYFDACIETWKNLFDYIFFYTSELCDTLSAQLIANKYDSLILMVKKISNSIEFIKRAQCQFKRSNTKLVGTILYS